MPEYIYWKVVQHPLSSLGLVSSFTIHILEFQGKWANVIRDLVKCHGCWFHTDNSVELLSAFLYEHNRVTKVAGTAKLLTLIQMSDTILGKMDPVFAKAFPEAFSLKQQNLEILVNLMLTCSMLIAFWK